MLLYEGQAAIPADTTQQVVILLKRNAYRFEPYGCQRLADSAHVVPYTEQPILGIPGSQFVFLVQDSTSNSVKPNQQRKVRSLTFRTGSTGIPREPFRVRIYKYKGPDQPPGEDLFTENFIICGKEGVFTYDLSLTLALLVDAFFEHLISPFALEPVRVVLSSLVAATKPCSNSVSLFEGVST